MSNRSVMIAAFAAVLAVAGSAPLMAAEAARSPRVLQFLSPDDISPGRILPPPPAEGSAANTAELAEVRRIMSAAAPDRIARAHWDDEHEDASAFADTISPGLDFAKLPATAEVMAIVRNDASIASNGGKAFFGRRRPWALDQAITPCGGREKSPVGAYPSGHGTLGYSTAMVLAVLVPEKAQALMTRADDYAVSRQICGVHYASDLRAAQALSAAMVTALLKNPDFAAKISTARMELSAAHLTAQPVVQ